jgi:hypothetical protein
LPTPPPVAPRRVARLPLERVPPVRGRLAPARLRDEEPRPEELRPPVERRPIERLPELRPDELRPEELRADELRVRELPPRELPPRELAPLALLREPLVRRRLPPPLRERALEVRPAREPPARPLERFPGLPTLISRCSILIPPAVCAGCRPCVRRGDGRLREFETGPPVCKVDARRRLARPSGGTDC